jgi:hypothetical protein
MTHRKKNNSRELSKTKRYFAFFMAINILFQVVSPTLALALTSGPGQPEMASFEPVGTSEMVDVFTGDFNYNIPLMTVPGPNGGYPINIAYHAGIGMDDEASWVGLGWNINPGVISRNMRGLPDDFNGEAVTKKLNIRPNRTASLGFGATFYDFEILGFKNTVISARKSLIWNNYKGIGVIGGLSASISNNNQTRTAGVNLNFNSLSGEMSLTPNMSFTDKAKHADNTYGLSMNISSLRGMKDLNFSMNREATKTKTKTITTDGGSSETITGSISTSAGSSTSFASSAFTPYAEFPTTGFNVSAEFNWGITVAPGVYKKNFDVNASYSQTKNKVDNINFEAYGYLYSNNRTISDPTSDEYKIMDVNRERETPLSKDIPSLPVPIHTYDTYIVKGQGIGGVFRPYRTDISLLMDPSIYGHTIGGSRGAEFGPGSPTHIGVNLAINYSMNYSGPWNDNRFYQEVFNNTNKGSAYFKLAGEMVADEDEEANFYLGTTPNMTVLADWEFDDLFEKQTNPLAEIRAGTGLIPGKSHLDNPKTRSQLMSYKTFSEVNHIPTYEDNFAKKSVYAKNANPLVAAPSGYTSVTPTSSDQIAEMSVINPDGNRYIYALPAINKLQKEVSFAVKHEPAGNGKLINYAHGIDNSVSNLNGADRFFSSTEIPQYVHSYMLTAIVSPDYVDLKNDGLTDDDFGYWVKFNYTKTASDYQWRMPFNGANYLKGYLSSTTDDKAGYTYGVKELWFLNSIETKSHIALFTLSDRFDAKGASSENTIYSGNPDQFTMDQSSGQQKLDKISLYSKNAPLSAPPIKEVNFAYNYELCKQTLNSLGGSAYAQNPDHGKLTLKKIYFSHLGNTKGSLSPYYFDYHASDPNENPNYAILKEDCWGNYKENSYGTDNTIFPYVNQSKYYNSDGYANSLDTLNRNQHASAWNLKEITLPSGGKIKVDYEADDYAYVHGKQAMELARIIGFGKTTTFSSAPSTIMNSANQYVYFEINDSKVTTDTDVKKCFTDIKDIYFKVFMDLKKNGIAGISKMDYVTGYAGINASDCGIAHSNWPGGSGVPSYKIGYVKINNVSVNDLDGLIRTHPFRKAGWQYLKLNRPDVLFPSSDALANSPNTGVAYLNQLVNALMGVFTSASQLMTGFYMYCSARGFCNEMVKSHLGTDYPSFIKLNCVDGVKYGGGNRVKQIVITDTWKETNVNPLVYDPKKEYESKYGQEYSYRLPDGSSSGVAAYEPLIGGEEIPYRKPIRYSSQYFINANENLYMEEPIGESYFPAATVGYSRVIVKNIKQTETPSSTTEVTKTKEGITVYEFYTTKDFPYAMNPRRVNPPASFKPKIPIPFIGSVSFENHGFTQGFDFTTNDMHGKAKSVSTYAAMVNVNNSESIPVSKIEYLYNTNASGGLENKVNVLFADGYDKMATMGVTEDKFIDNRQTFGISANIGLQTNFNIFPLFVVPTIMPTLDYAEDMYKSMVDVKVISLSGILMETRAFNEGSSVSTKNLMFDAYTGKPLLTTVTNNFDKPIYKYEYAAQWAYEGMQSAYKNDRAYVIISPSGVIAPNQNVFPGDELLVTYGGVNVGGVLVGGLYIGGTTTGSLYTKVWVKPDGFGSFKAILEDGSNFSTLSTVSATGLVIRSGRRNQQSISNGSIVSLTNPVTDRKYDLFDKYNLSPIPPPSINVIDCGGNKSGTYDIDYESNFIIFYALNRTCSLRVQFDANIPTPNNYKLKKAGSKAFLINPATNAVVLIGDIIDNCGLSECLDGVLNASVAEFKDEDWNYDYVDVGDPNVNFSSSAKLSSLISLSTVNPYRIGTKSIWRMDKSWAFQTERLQNSITGFTANTKIQDDGTFKKFVLFDWSKSTVPTKNNNWTNVNTVTKYSPYGFELENKNAIGIRTSALYGYANSLQTAISNNASYYETAFDGFEDYGNVTNYPINLSKGGHINIGTNTGAIAFDNANKHTGKKSIKGTGAQQLSVTAMATTPSVNNYSFQIQPNKKYTMSAWFKTNAGKPTITATGAASSEVFADNIIIEGWQKVDLNFTTDATATTVTLKLKVDGTTSDWFLDDIRIQPFKSTMKTFVYDPASLWLVAELDNQNYATFYNYDEEGVLTQVKKETVNGVQTLKTTRSNLKR